VIVNRFWVHVLAALTLGAPSTNRQEGVLHLVPSSGPIPVAFFGMHIHNAAGATPWPDVPIPAWRLWDARVSWPQLEPSAGQWNFELLDKFLALAEAHETEVLLPLGLSPHWASARPQEKSVYQPGFAAEPRNMQDWRDYVTTVVTHCKGRVRAYEIWNEPNKKGFYSGTTEEMVALAKEASEIIHRIDPAATVVSPAATENSGVDWLTEFLRDGGGRYVDVIAFHFYVAPQPPEAMVPLIERVKQAMAAAGAGDKPLWNTEAGWHVPKPFPSDALAAAYLTRAFLVNWAAGVSRFYWYAWDNHSFVSVQTTEPDNRTLTPAGLAFGVIQTWLRGAQMNACDEDGEQHWACHFTRDGASFQIVWNATESKPLVLPESWQGRFVTPLLSGTQPLRGPSLVVGPVPQRVQSIGPN
jgi:hypothetical protein